MKLIIDIPEEVYEDIKYRFDKQDYDCGYIVSSAIANGIPLEEELKNAETRIKDYLNWCDEELPKLRVNGVHTIFCKLKGEQL